ncbi:MAG: hypothetical protein RL621_1543 [Bacteroidota bacterium]|jgi:hypothetical protein
MIMDCPHCRKEYYILNETLDKDALKDLKDQIDAEDDPILKQQLQSKRDILKAEIGLESSITKSLSRSKAQLIRTVKEVLKGGRGEYLLALSPADLKSFLLRNGLADAVSDFETSQLNITNYINEMVRAYEPQFNINTSPILTSILGRTSQSLFDDLIISQTTRSLKDAVYNSSLVGADVAIKQMQDELDSSTSKQVSEARTKISQYSRTVVSEAAQIAGLEYYIYTGPKDTITRPFCRDLVGKVLSADQIKKLGNGSSLISGGGYNCRHSWSPISKAYLKVKNIEPISDEEIKRINKL